MGLGSWQNIPILAGKRFPVRIYTLMIPSLTEKGGMS